MPSAFSGYHLVTAGAFRRLLGLHLAASDSRYDSSRLPFVFPCCVEFAKCRRAGDGTRLGRRRVPSFRCAVDAPTDGVWSHFSGGFSADCPSVSLRIGGLFAACVSGRSGLQAWCCFEGAGVCLWSPLRPPVHPPNVHAKWLFRGWDVLVKGNERLPLKSKVPSSMGSPGLVSSAFLSPPFPLVFQRR